MKQGRDEWSRHNENTFSYWLFLLPAEAQNLVIDKKAQKEKLHSKKGSTDYYQYLKNFRKLMQKQFGISKNFFLLREYDEKTFGYTMILYCFTGSCEVISW